MWVRHKTYCVLAGLPKLAAVSLGAGNVTGHATACKAAPACRVTQALEGEGLQVDAVALQDGERFKSMDELQKVWTAALEHRLNRGAPSLVPCRRMLIGVAPSS